MVQGTGVSSYGRRAHDPDRRNGEAGVAAHGPRFEGARCHGADPEVFFGPPGVEQRMDRYRREAAAKALCHECPAMLACRDHALRNAEVYGVWGGLGEQERRLQLARLGRLAHSA
jgi:WhiB family transcriptional regulator, redox-sensing transcriptional regulator